MTREQIKIQALVRGGWSTTYAITDTNMNTIVDRAHRWAAGYHKWPFTEGRVSTTMVTTQIDEDGEIVYDYPEGWKSDSIRLMQIGGKRVQKITWEDYKRFREDQSSGKDRVFSDLGNRYFINPNIDVSGTIALWGQFTPATIDGANDDVNSVFAGNNEEGDEAVIEMSMAGVYERLGNIKNKDYHEQNAHKLLDELWKRITDEQFGYQTKDRGEFKRIDVLSGWFKGELRKEDQFF